jgi:anti-anti-sigma factor
MGYCETLAEYNARHPLTRVRMSRDDGRHAITIGLTGELDMKASSDLTPLLEASVLECPENGRLVLDLASVTYIASMGVGLMASLLVKAEKKSVSLVLLDIPPRVRGIMDVLGLLSFFREERSASP